MAYVCNVNYKMNLQLDKGPFNKAGERGSRGDKIPRARKPGPRSHNNFDCSIKSLLHNYFSLISHVVYCC